MDAYHAVGVNQLARMFAERIKHEKEEWRKRKEAEVLRRRTKKAEKIRKEEEKLKKEEEAHIFREMALERFFNEGVLAPMNRDPGVEALRVEQETHLVRELETKGKAKEARALEKLRQDFANFNIQEAGHPHQKNQSHPQPSRSYYWPQGSPSESPAAGLSWTGPGGVLTPQLDIPSILVTAPDSEPESSPHTRQAAIDTSMLSPADARRISPPRRRKSSKSKACKSKEKISTHQKRAPKLSGFFYDVCDHPQCPLTYTHEKGVFLYPGKYATDEEYAAAAVTFGDSNPPPMIWDAYFNAMHDLQASYGNTEAVNQEDIGIIRGFLAAHPKP